MYETEWVADATESLVVNTKTAPRSNFAVVEAQHNFPVSLRDLSGKRKGRSRFHDRPDFLKNLN
jgi:hypothetical protein